VSRKVTVDTAYTLKFAGWKRTVESTALVFKTELRKEGPRTFVLEQSLEFRGLMLPPSEADKYRAIVAEIDQSDLVFSGQVGKRGMFLGADGPNDNDTWADGATTWLWRLVPLALLLGYWAWRYTTAP